MLIKSQIETYSGITNRITTQQLQYMIIFCTRSTHKFEACRNVIEKIAYGYGCPMRTRTTVTLRYLASTYRELQCRLLLTSNFGLDGTANQFNFRYRGYTGKCLATKTKRMQTTEILNVRDLAGRMTLTHMLQLVLRYAISIIGDADQAQSPTTQFDTDILRTRIQRVLNQLFNH